MSAYPNLHLIAYGTGGARLNRSELAVEAADALERLAFLGARTCDGCEAGDSRSPAGPDHVWCRRFNIFTRPDHYCALWSAPDPIPAHDKEKSST